VIETLTGDQLNTAFLNGVSPFCNPAIATGRFPQISGLKIQFHCTGTTPVIDGIWKAPNGPGGALTPVGPADTVRLVTNDFMFTGGDGYTAEVTLADLQADKNAIITADQNGAFRNIIPTQMPKVWVKGLVKLDVQ